MKNSIDQDASESLTDQSAYEQKREKYFKLLKDNEDLIQLIQKVRIQRFITCNQDVFK